MDAETTHKTISIDGSTISSIFNLSGQHKDWSVVGSAIGKVVSDKFTITIGDNNIVTDSHKMDIADVTTKGANSDGGGLIGYITSAGSYSDRKVTINKLEFEGAEVRNAASTNGGGFLGYAWRSATANIKHVTVEDGTVSGTANTGAMVYEATGKWVVDHLEVKKATIENSGTSLGMIVNKAFVEKERNNTNYGLYLNVLKSGYTLNTSEGAIKLPSTLGVYDELAAYSAPKDEPNQATVLKGNGGVVSINMGERNDNITAVTSTGTYQNQLNVTNNKANPNARYYYNLDKMGTTDKGEDLVLWSTNKYAASNIKSEFVSSFTANDTLTGDADLTGLSYYPLYSAPSCTLSGLTLTFDYSGIYNVENSGAGGSDGYVRDPGATGAERNQHYLMHAGLFINQPDGDVQSEGNTLTVTGALSIGGKFLEIADDGSSSHNSYLGALFSGTVRGKLDSRGGSIVLNGLEAKKTGNNEYTDGYLLINRIDRQDTLHNIPKLYVSNVSTSGYNGVTQPIAKSLIGPATGKALIIEFSGIKLDARNTAGDAETSLATLDTVYGTTRSIFSEASLLMSIYTDQDATLVYNYTKDEDWGSGNRKVTYGQEIQTSLEYRGKEDKYIGTDRHYTNPTDRTTTDSTGKYTSFDTYFLRYVYQEYDPENKDSNGLFYRELKVNVAAEGIDTGCGTYNDPYEITSAASLTAIATFISKGSEAKPTDLGPIILPNAAANYVGVAANAKDHGWCTQSAGTDFHSTFTPDDATGKFVSSVDSSIKWSKEDVQLYLVNAYYKINNTGTFELDNTYPGLGGTSANLAFRGVIVGVPGQTIVNNSGNPFINISNGCVVKDLTVRVGAGVTLTQENNAYNNAYFGYNSQCAYYGGIIGEIMGGDNIIDNSYVEYINNSTITLTGTNGTIVHVGGYVGVVVFGGLIFKNMKAANTTLASTGLRVYYTTNNNNNLAEDKEAAWAAIYVNPIVGRVINGYAVNETGGKAKDANGTLVQQFSVTEDGHYHDEGRTSGRSGNQHTLKNGMKHYSIADIDPYYGEEAEDWNKLTDAQKNALRLDVTPPSSTTANGTINVPNAQALFILSLITQSTSGTAQTVGGAYQNSLSYGINTEKINNVDTELVYGMSHNADYTNVGSAFFNTDNDYVAASDDTAANTAVPYIIRKYTNYYENSTVIEAGSLNRDVKYLDGAKVYIKVKNNTAYLNDEEHTNNSPKRITATRTQNDAAMWTLELAPGETDKFYIFTTKNDTNYYLKMEKQNDKDGHLEMVGKAQADKLTVTKINDYYVIKNNDGFYIDNWGGKPENGFASYKGGNPGGNEQLDLIAVEEYTYTEKGYPARCVSSTLGYYDINLTNQTDGYVYQLPDSFRGLGSVGYYDDTKTAGSGKFDGDGVNNREQNKYCMKVHVFSGAGQTIDADIYLNKYQYDNYFNSLHRSSKATQSVQSEVTGYSLNTNTDFHGIGLFDSIIMKDKDSVVDNFTLTGSVNTEIYNNSYKAASREQTGMHAQYAWLSVGGVVGSAINGTGVNFKKINLNNFSVRGSCYVAGLLAMSGNRSTTKYITVQECSADSLSIVMAATGNGDNNNPRSAAAAFVGKVKEGGVKIYGTDSKEDNNSDERFSTVKLKKFETVDDRVVVPGGLVSYAGHGAQIYDMKIMPQDNNTTITFGGDTTQVAGGLCSLMQNADNTDKKNLCYATFKNCTVERINVKAAHAGGLYGGTWSNDWAVYKLDIENCHVIGKSTKQHNLIQAVDASCGASFGNTRYSYAGGLVGKAYVVAGASDGEYNVRISNSKVQNYDITDENDKNNNCGSGGFIGYADTYAANITMYIHDSSVEDCKIGAPNNYAGGAVGRINKKTSNKLLGYNIKLDDVTSDSSNMGAWIGYLDSEDTGTSIQIVGVAIYGNGFTKNVGNGVELNNASFVFASYVEEKNKVITDRTDLSSFNCTWDNQEKTFIGHVDMPKYPYVNVNPLSSMGTSEHISGDGAAVYDDNGTIEPMAEKIYNDLSNVNNSRRYTTFNGITGDDAKIFNNKTIGDYFDSNSEGDRITTFKTLHGITGETPFDDFAVVVISNNETYETTNLINQYIRLVTNTKNNYAKVDNSSYKIVIKSCIFDESEGIFKFDSSDSPIASSIEYTDNQNPEVLVDKVFMPVPSNADSLAPDYRFSLVDVQFLDPLDSSKIAYHLYVPVYVEKEIEVTFNTSVKSGTLSASDSANPYVPVSPDKWDTEYYLDGLETWITQYVRFTYTQLDLQAFLDKGEIDWAHIKTVLFKKFGGNDQNAYELPNNTKLVLVDPNGDRDKAYYADISDFSSAAGSDAENWSLPLGTFKDVNSTPFEYRTIGELLQGNVTIDIVEDNSGNYRLFVEGVDNEADAVTINNVKYVPKIGGDIKIKVNGDVSEDYYILQYVPKPVDYSGELYSYTITTDDYLKTERGSNKSRVIYDGNGNTKNVVLSDAFAQSETSFKVSPEDVVITSDKNEITIKATTSIRPKNDSIFAYLNNKPVFHSFYVNLNRYTETGVDDKIFGLDNLDRASISAEYKINNGTVTQVEDIELDGEGHYINVITGDIEKLLEGYWFDKNTPSTPLKIETTIRLSFDPTMLENEFPSKPANSENNNNSIGVRAEVASNLAFEKEHLYHTSMTEQLTLDNEEPKYFHREISADVVLYYYSIDEFDEQDYFGKMSDNYSRYGVNGFFWPENSNNNPKYPAAREQYMANKGTGMRKNAEASYNVIEIENDIKNAEYLRVTIRLQKKQNIKENNAIVGAE